MIQEIIRHPFPPLFLPASEILILGTMPSPKSRERSFFYMHSQNRFWKVLSEIFEEKLNYKNNGKSINDDIENLDAAIEERKNLILNHKLALWDVLSTCSINGASDSSIKNAEVNDFSELLKSTKIKKIVCTGKTAWNLYEKFCAEKTGIHAECLPSTSSANAAWNFEKLCEEYRRNLVG